MANEDESLTPTQAEDLIRNAARRAELAAIAVGEAAPQIIRVAREIADRLRQGGKILVFGNGGSAACAQHFAAEFTGKLASDRVPYPAISLTVDTSALTAIANDYGYEHVFSRQVRALARPEDAVVGISTSGTSRNVAAAIDVAREVGALTISLTGADDALGADLGVAVPLRETARVQEAHDLILHEFAQLIERFLEPTIADDKSADRFPFVLQESDLAPYRAWLRRSSQSLATTNGVFDLVHQGHRASLRAAKREGDALVVLVNSDDSVRRLKGAGRPVRSLDDRLTDLRSIPHVTHVVVMDDDDPRRLLAALEPDVHCKGADYAGRPLIESEVVESAGGRIALIDLLEGYSTTNLVDAMTENDD
ncbi:SIS domain-containing protein [Oerskovia sp. KBS0722]|uniref:SIS domain-containing protein n=1 Tax=Oerskovia sp. KBS0722 TaxID=1179673 RepID=UPI00110E233F|nr:SIS domain-containing protein [Oerskovia sp. KBS0722]